MKQLILTLITLTFIFSCSNRQKEKQNINFKLASITSGISVTGGTFVKMVSGEKSKLVLLDGNDSTLVDFGTWDFYVVAFQGPGPLGGNTYCGAITNFTVDSTPTIPTLTINNSNCGSSPFPEVLNDIFNMYGNPFVSLWRTTSPAENIELPLNPGFNYNFTVDWGDGSAPQTITSNSDPNKIHNYATAGDYVVVITGLIESWNFGSYGTATKIIEVINFGNMGWKNLSNAFQGCTNLTAFSGGDTDEVTSMSNMFYGTSNLTNIDLSTFNTSNVTTMAGMFGSSGAVSLDLRNFDTSHVTDMGMMFTSMHSLISLNISTFDTSSVTTMYSMFNDSTVLTSLDLSNFSNTSVTNMSWMFTNMTALQNLNLTNFGTPAVTNMTFMFANSPQLLSLDLSSFNTSLVTNMSYMFSNTPSITTLDLHTFVTNNVTNMDNIFASMTSLTSLDTTDWSIVSASGSINVFDGTSSVTVYCNQGGSPGTGSFFTESCN